MLTIDLLSQTLPYLHPDDKVYQALQLMNDNQVNHLPIADGEIRWADQRRRAARRG